MVSANSRPTSAYQIKQRIGQNLKLFAQREDLGRGDAIPVLVIVIVAVVGTDVILFNKFARTSSPATKCAAIGESAMLKPSS